MISRGVLFRLHHGKRKSAASSQGVFHIELPDELSWTTDSTGHLVRMPVVNLLCCNRDDAESRAEEVIHNRELQHNLINDQEKHMDNTLIEYADKDGKLGNPINVWNRYLSHICSGLIKANGAEKATIEMLDQNVRRAMYRRHGVLDDFATWYGDKPLTQVDKSDVDNYINAKTSSEQFDAEVFKTQTIDVLAEIWKVALPMCENHWSNVKYDPKRNSITGRPIPPANELLRMGLLEFAELYFANEAASGRKWEANTRGFVTHFMEHSNAKIVADVTKAVACEYAIALHDDENAKTARSGSDRLSKFRTMWNTMMPDVANPWDNVTYESALAANIYNAALKKQESLESISSRLRCVDPHALFEEYSTLHKFKPHRYGTVKSIFMRMWNKTGIHRPLDLTREMAFNYVNEIHQNKKSWDQDRSEIATMWSVLFPGHPNFWLETTDHVRMTQIRKGEISFSQTRSDSATESARRRREAGEFDHNKTEPPVVDNTPPAAPSVNTEKKTDVKKAIDELFAKYEKKSQTDFLDAPFKKEPAPVETPVLKGRMSIDDKLENGVPLTFNELYGNWKRKNPKYKKHTYDSYKNELKRVEKYCELQNIYRVSPLTITVDLVEKFMKSSFNGCAKATRLTALSILKSIWDDSFTTGENPWRTVYFRVLHEEGQKPLVQDSLFKEEPTADKAKPKETEAVETVQEPTPVVEGPTPVVKDPIPVMEEPTTVVKDPTEKPKRRKSWVRRLFEKMFFSWF